MIAIERRTAGLFRAAVRRCFDGPGTRADQIPIQLRLDRDGLVMHASTPDDPSPIVVIYRQPDIHGNGVFTFPLKHFAECEGRAPGSVEIALQRPDLASLRWSDKGRQREIEVPLLEPESVAKAPDLPKRWAPISAEFLRAFDEASQAAADTSSKYVLNHVQIRGKHGSVVGTDTRQLIISGGFNFAFKEDLLVPRARVFGASDFAGSGDIGIALTERHFCIRTGPWTFCFLIDKHGRFPDAESIVPKTSAAESRLRLDEEDAQRFLNSLARRLKAGKENSVTLDLGKESCLRYEFDERVTEIRLTKSEFSGKPIRVCISLPQFLRALELRFDHFEFRDADRPFVSRDGNRLFMSVPLSSSSALPPRPDAFRVPDNTPEPSRALATAAKRAVAKSPIVVPCDHQTISVPSATFDILSEADGLKDGLFKVATHAGKILRFLREACTRQQLLDTVRTSLLSLTNNTSRGGPQ